MQIPKDYIEKEIARRSHLEFIKYTWSKTEQFVTGFHTSKICQKIDEAFEKFRAGVSSYYVVKVPFRHGKTETITRTSVPHFLGEFPECEVISTAYSTSLTNKFSRDARNILKSKKFSNLYPNCKPSREAFNVQEWSLENGVGRTLWTGISGGLTGNGAHFAIVDDPFNDREEAESELIRNKRWEAFIDSLMSRLAPVHIVIVCATPWHTDDFFGRIEEKMENDPHFAQFEELCFPARAKDYKGDGQYPNEYLFEERYPKKWYEMQYAIRTKYQSAGLLDCSPIANGSGLIKIQERVNWHFVDEKPQGFSRLARGWDLASSSKQTQKDDPDWTVGVRGAVKIESKNLSNFGQIGIIVHIYIDNIVRMREEAPKRNQKIIETAIRDGYSCTQFVEAFASYKDSYTILKEVLKGISIVEKAQLQGDKVAKASSTIQVPFEFGNVYFNRNIDKDTLDEFLSVLGVFPSGKHDDDVDALSVLVGKLTESNYNLYGNGVLS